MQLSWTDRIVMIAVLVVAVMIHEVAHGLAALWCGDPTARDMGRLSFNPLRHIDPFGTIILPALLALSGAGVVFGWAKPVPINLGRTRNPRAALWITALAGPLSNLAQAALAGLALRVIMGLGWMLPVWLELVLQFACVINVVLLVFNLLPIPPLDGSRVVAALLPPSLAVAYLSIEKFGFLILFLLLRYDLLDGITSRLTTGLVELLLPTGL